MSLVLLLLGCAKQVSWQVQPRPSYELPSLDVSVVAGDRTCKRVADELASTLSARPGVLVRPDAPVRLEVRECEDEVDTRVEVESNTLGLQYGGAVVNERRRYEMRGWGNALLVVIGGGPVAKLTGTAERRVRGQWVDPTDLEIPRALALRESVRRDLAYDLADQVAPLPATIRRTIYRDPEPGTSRQRHNEAVEAERRGDLDEALRLAREAYAANPTEAGMRYVEDLQDHARAVGYALRPVEPPVETSEPKQ